MAPRGLYSKKFRTSAKLSSVSCLGVLGWAVGLLLRTGELTTQPERVFSARGQSVSLSRWVSATDCSPSCLCGLERVVGVLLLVGKLNSQFERVSSAVGQSVWLYWLWSRSWRGRLVPLETLVNVTLSCLVKPGKVLSNVIVSSKMSSVRIVL